MIYDCLSRRIQQPSSLVLTCADANSALMGLRWTDWGDSTASAAGVWSENDCTPNCATGKFSNYPATVTVTDLRNGAYTWLEITAPTAPFHKADFTLTDVGPQGRPMG